MTTRCVLNVLLGTAVVLTTSAALAQSHDIYNCSDDGTCTSTCETPCDVEAVECESCAPEVPPPVPACANPVEGYATPCSPPMGVLQAEPAIDVLPGEFVCHEHPRLPTTVFYSPEGTMPVIRWASHYFSASGYDPLTRCREVSNRFQRYYDSGVLNYITTGVVNRQPVVCVADVMGGPCQGVLFTLRPDEDASQIVQRLFDVSYAMDGPLYESGTRVYLNVREYLDHLTLHP